MDDVLQTEERLSQRSGLIFGVASSLYFRNYRMLWLGNVLTSGSQWMENVATGWLMLVLSGSPFMVGLVAFCRGIPMLVLSPIAGVLADRLDRRRFLILNQTLIAVLALILASLILLQWITSWELLLLSFLSGTTFAMIVPTRQALVPDLVGRRHMSNAVALYSIGNNVTRIVGPSVGGALIALVGTAACYYLETVAYLGTLWTSVVMRAPTNVDASDSETIWENLRAGFAHIAQDRCLRSLLLVIGLANLFGMPYLSMLPVLARDEYHVEASALGLMVGCMGLGALVGSTSLAAWGTPPRRGTLAAISAAVFGLAIVALSLSDSIYLGSVSLAIVGVSNSFNLALANTLLHELTPPPMRGRVMSAWVMTFGLQPIGSLAIGWLAERTNASLAIGLGGGITIVSALVVLLVVPELRRLA